MKCSMLHVYPSMGAETGPETQEVECTNPAEYVEENDMMHGVCGACHEVMRAEDPALVANMCPIIYEQWPNAPKEASNND